MIGRAAHVAFAARPLLLWLGSPQAISMQTRSPHGDWPSQPIDPTPTTMRGRAATAARVAANGIGQRSSAHVSHEHAIERSCVALGRVLGRRKGQLQGEEAHLHPILEDAVGLAPPPASQLRLGAAACSAGVQVLPDLE